MLCVSVHCVSMHWFRCLQVSSYSSLKLMEDPDSTTGCDMFCVSALLRLLTLGSSDDGSLLIFPQISNHPYSTSFCIVSCVSPWLRLLTLSISNDDLLSFSLQLLKDPYSTAGFVMSSLSMTMILLSVSCLILVESTFVFVGGVMCVG